MGSRARGIGLSEPGLILFWGEMLPVPAWGDGIHLSTRVDLNGLQLCSILGGELEPGWQADRGTHCGRDCRRYCMTGYGLGCGGMTACWGTGLSNVLCNWACFSWVIWHIWDFLHLWSFCHLIGECCRMVAGSTSACTGQCSGLDYHRHRRTVPGLEIDLGDGNSHICCSRGKWIGHWHEWRMLMRSLL